MATANEVMEYLGSNVKPRLESLTTAVQAAIGSLNNAEANQGVIAEGKAEQAIKELTTQIENGIIVAKTAQTLEGLSADDIINEAIEGVDIIDDEKTSRTKTYSSKKIMDLLALNVEIDDTDLSRDDATLSSKKIQALIAAAAVEGISEEQIKELIKEHGGGISEEEARELVARALDELPKDESGLGTEAVNELIAEALKDLPQGEGGLSENQVNELIANALKELGASEGGAISEGGVSEARVREIVLEMLKKQSEPTHSGQGIPNGNANRFEDEVEVGDTYKDEESGKTYVVTEKDGNALTWEEQKAPNTNVTTESLETLKEEIKKEIAKEQAAETGTTTPEKMEQMKEDADNTGSGVPESSGNHKQGETYYDRQNNKLYIWSNVGGKMDWKEIKTKEGSYDNPTNEEVRVGIGEEYASIMEAISAMPMAETITILVTTTLTEQQATLNFENLGAYAAKIIITSSGGASNIPIKLIGHPRKEVFVDFDGFGFTTFSTGAISTGEVAKGGVLRFINCSFTNDIRAYYNLSGLNESKIAESPSFDFVIKDTRFANSNNNLGTIITKGNVTIESSNPNNKIVVGSSSLYAANVKLKNATFSANGGAIQNISYENTDFTSIYSILCEIDFDGVSFSGNMSNPNSPKITLKNMDLGSNSISLGSANNQVNIMLEKVKTTSTLTAYGSQITATDCSLGSVSMTASGCSLNATDCSLGSVSMTASGCSLNATDCSLGSVSSNNSQGTYKNHNITLTNCSYKVSEDDIKNITLQNLRECTINATKSKLSFNSYGSSATLNSSITLKGCEIRMTASSSDKGLSGGTLTLSGNANKLANLGVSGTVVSGRYTRLNTSNPINMYLASNANVVLETNETPSTSIITSNVALNTTTNYGTLKITRAEFNPVDDE